MTRHFRRLIPLAAVLTGCFPVLPPRPTPHEAMVVAAPLAATWDAVIDVFASEGIPIRTMERTSGFIGTDLIGSRGMTDLGNCGTDGLFQLIPERATLNALVRGDSLRSTVRVTAAWRHRRSEASMIDVPAGDCTTTWKLETELERKIKAAAEASGKATPR